MDSTFVLTNPAAGKHETISSRALPLPEPEVLSEMLLRFHVQRVLRESCKEKVVNVEARQGTEASLAVPKGKEASIAFQLCPSVSQYKAATTDSCHLRGAWTNP